MQVDVLDTQYSVLLQKIKSTHDFETVKNAHSDFLSILQSQLFFSLDPVSNIPCLHTFVEYLIILLWASLQVLENYCLYGCVHS